MTKLFEYPSETSLLEEVEVKLTTVKQIEQDSRDTALQLSTSNSKGIFDYLQRISDWLIHRRLLSIGGGLSNFTPSKVHIETTFELGVSRSTRPDLPQSEPTHSANQTGPMVHFIKPAEESTTWSAETTSDLLF